MTSGKAGSLLDVINIIHFCLKSSINFESKVLLTTWRSACWSSPLLEATIRAASQRIRDESGLEFHPADHSRLDNAFPDRMDFWRFPKGESSCQSYDFHLFPAPLSFLMGLLFSLWGSHAKVLWKWFTVVDNQRTCIGTGSFHQRNPRYRVRIHGVLRHCSGTVWIVCADNSVAAPWIGGVIFYWFPLKPLNRPQLSSVSIICKWRLIRFTSPKLFC